MRILITGAGGYIGSPVVEQFISQLKVEDFDVEYVIAVDRVEIPPNADVTLEPNAEWISANLDEVDESWWADIVSSNSIDTIYYLETFENLNLCGAPTEIKNIFELSDFHFTGFLEGRDIINPSKIKVLYLSTDKIYYQDDFPNELHNIELQSVAGSTDNNTDFYSYVATKALTEIKLQLTQNVDLRILRPFSITGPARNYGCPITNSIQKAFLGDDIQLYKRGVQGVAYTHINDLVTFLIHPNLFNPDIKLELTTNIINFCRVQNYLSVRQLTEKIVNKTESTTTITNDNPINIYNEVQDTPQIRNMVKIYQPTIPIEIILDDMINDIDPINHYKPLVVMDVIINETAGSIQIIGSAEPSGVITAWFGNGEVTTVDLDENGDFHIDYTFEFAIDIYPIELKVAAEGIQYASHVILKDS